MLSVFRTGSIALKKQTYKANLHMEEPRRVEEKDFDRFDYIFAMDDSNYDALRRMAPTVEDVRKVRRMSEFLQHYVSDSIPDPYYGGASGFENVLNLLEDACEGVYKKLKNGGGL